VCVCVAMKDGGGGAVREHRDTLLLHSRNIAIYNSRKLAQHAVLLKFVS